MRAVDTNVLIRLITTDDPRQTRAMENFVRNGAWVSTLALAEAVWVLGTVYKLPAGTQVTAIEILLHHSDLVLQDAEALTAALGLFRTKPALGFSD